MGSSISRRRLVQCVFTLGLAGAALMLEATPAYPLQCPPNNPNITCPSQFVGPTGTAIGIKQSVWCYGQTRCCEVGTMYFTWNCVPDGQGISQPQGVSASPQFCRDQRWGVNCCDNPNWCPY